jgi:oleate hydratase
VRLSFTSSAGQHFRRSWEAIYVLLKRGHAPPPVYQSQYDPKALINALKVFV